MATETQPRQSSHSGRISTANVLIETFRHLVRDPVSVVPFAVAGVLVALADWLRTHDPIPVGSTDAMSQGISLQYAVFPHGSAQTVRYLDALVSLETRYFLYAVGLETVVTLVIGIAGWVTIARVLDVRYQPRTLGLYLGALIVLITIPRLAGVPSINIDQLVVGLVLLAILLFVFVRLFLLPARLVIGDGMVPALTKSWQQSRGSGLSFAGLIVLFGVAYWGLATVPLVGGFLSTAIVAPIHAVSVGRIASIQRES